MANNKRQSHRSIYWLSLFTISKDLPIAASLMLQNFQVSQIVFVFCRFVFRLISTVERSMIRVETHLKAVNHPANSGGL